MDIRAALRDLVRRYQTRTTTRDLALGLALITAAVLAAAGWLNYAAQANRVEGDLSQRADVLADELAQILAAPLETADLDRLSRTAAAYRGLDTVAGLVVVDASGTVRYRSVPDEGDPLRRTRIVYSGSRLVGQLELWLSHRSLAALRQNALVATSATILAVVLALWVATDLLLQRHLARPLQRITRAIDRIGVGHYDSSMEPVPQADITGLIDQINAMARQMAERDAAVRQVVASISDDAERSRPEQVQAAIYRISEAALTTPTLEELYSSLHAIVAELMPARNFFIALYDAPTDLLHFAYHADEEDTAWEPLRPHKTLTGYVLQTGKSLLATAEVFERMVQAGLVELVGGASQDWLGVPLKTQQAVLGVMVVQTYRDAPRLGEAERDILTFVSTQVAMAIERKQAEEALRLDESRLDALARLNEMTDSSEKAITDFALAEAVRLTKSNIGYLGSLNEAEDTLTMFSALGNALAGDPDGRGLPIFTVTTGGPLDDVVRRRKPVVVNSGPLAARLPDHLPPGHVPVRRYVLVPVFEGEHIVLVANVGNKEEPYDEADVRQLTLLMQGMWRILQRGRAIAEIRRLNADLERRVEERTAQLTAVNQELEAFAYSVSHDLRAPLRAINGFSQTMLEDYGGKVDAEGHSTLHRIRAATVRMAQLIDDLLQLSRVTRSEIRLREVDLCQLVREGVARLCATEPAREVEVIIPQQRVVRADASLMRIALDNLLDNAWKFTGQRQAAQIEFGFRDQAGPTVFFIRDNGAGFDSAYVGKLFGAFQRLHASDEFEGTGIGLAIVQRIIRRHGGEIWAEGAVDQGATFYFTLG